MLSPVFPNAQFESSLLIPVWLGLQSPVDTPGSPHSRAGLCCASQTPWLVSATAVATSQENCIEAVRQSASRHQDPDPWGQSSLCQECLTSEAKINRIVRRRIQQLIRKKTGRRKVKLAFCLSFCFWKVSRFWYPFLFVFWWRSFSDSEMSSSLESNRDFFRLKSGELRRVLNISEIGNLSPKLSDCTWLDWKTGVALTLISWPLVECWGYFETLAAALAHSVSLATCSCGRILLKPSKVDNIILVFSPRKMDGGPGPGADVLRWHEMALLLWAGALRPAPAELEARALQEVPHRVKPPPGPGEDEWFGNGFKKSI